MNASRFHPSRALAALALIVCMNAQATTVYRWVDERGRMHFGDQRSDGAHSVDVRPGSGPSPPADTASTLQTEECQRRKSQLETYRQATSVVETDALGQRHEYDPQQKARLLQIGEQQVQNACGKS